MHNARPPGPCLWECLGLARGVVLGSIQGQCAVVSKIAFAFRKALLAPKTLLKYFLVSAVAPEKAKGKELPPALPFRHSLLNQTDERNALAGDKNATGLCAGGGAQGQSLKASVGKGSCCWLEGRGAFW